MATLVGTELDDTLTGATENDLIQGLGGNDSLSGSSGNDTLEGGAGNDTLLGGAGNDSLKGGTGADSMTGGTGNDVYEVDDAGDTVVEWNDSITGGVDLVNAAISYTLGNSVENLTLTGTASINGTGNTVANVITGNAGANLLMGNAGNDTLTGAAGDDTLKGGTGADSMTGGTGNDLYEVDDAGDVVVEWGDSVTGGVDTVQSSISYTLGNSVENLTLTGAAAINGTGNTVANVLTGNSAANILNGGVGNDTLHGMSGNDTLLGGTGNDSLFGGYGADSMTGGSGDDVYEVDSAGDVVVEWGDSVSGGVDLVNASVSYTLAASVENLTLTGTGPINGTGNTVANLLTGNSAANVLNGGQGDDTLLGHEGNDTLLGGAGNDQLIGGSGADSMTGGTGNDAYWVDDAGDKVVEWNDSVTGGVDVVFASISYTLGGSVENLYLYSGGASINGTGNALANEIVGNWTANILTGNAGDDSLYGGDGNDTLLGGIGNDLLDGGLGADSMTGGNGNDVYEVDNAGDVVVEWNDSIGGVDTVNASISYTLGNALENLTLTGGEAINGTGNAQANVITGNDASNTLNGEAGNDLLIGGMAYDQLYGDAGDDTLDGGAGNDDLAGGTGNDVYLFGPGAGADWLMNGAEDWDTTIDAVQFAPGITQGDVEFTISGYEGDSLLVTLTSTGDSLFIAGYFYGYGHEIDEFRFADAPVLTGAEILALIFAATEGDDTITGTSGDDTIDGLGGDDRIESRGGNDLLIGGAGVDSLSGEGGDDTLDGGAGGDDLSGGQGNDVYVFGPGYGFDFVMNLSPDADTTTDAVQFAAGVVPGDVGFSREWDSLRVSLPATGDTLMIAGHFSGDGEMDEFRFDGGPVLTAADVWALMNAPTEGHDQAIGTAGNDTIDGLGGNDSIEGLAGDDLLIGGAGDDSLFGASGGDVYFFGTGDGNDFIEDYSVGGNFGVLTSHAGATNSGNEIVDPYPYNGAVNVDSYALGTLAVGVLHEINVTWANYDTVLKVVDENGAVVAFNDDWTGTWSRLEFVPEEGKSYTVYVGGYLDTRGSYEIDVSEALPEVDAIQFGAGITPLDVTFQRMNGVDLLITAGPTDSIQVSGQFESQSYQIEEFRFDGGPVLSAWDVWVLVNTPTEGDDSIVGSGNGDLIEGLGGNDTLYGGDGNDSLYGGAGDDWLDGEGGNDLLEGGDGVDNLFGGGGDDTLVGGGGADYLVGGDGFDVLVVADTGFFGIDGGGDMDVLQLAGGSLTLDLTAMMHLFGIESVDLGAGGNTLVVDVASALGVSQEIDMLWVVGDGSDTVSFADAGWTITDAGVDFDRWENGGATLFIDTDVTVQFA